MNKKIQVFKKNCSYLCIQSTFKFSEDLLNFQLKSEQEPEQKEAEITNYSLSCLIENGLILTSGYTIYE
jgi:hypothetical protein